MSNSNNPILITLLFLSLTPSIIGQNISKKKDSLIQNYLISNKILDSPIKVKKYQDGKIKETSNYYTKENFLKDKDSPIISLIVFGANREHPKDYLLIINNACTENQCLFLGSKILEEDIILIEEYFKRCSDLSLKNKREILKSFSLLR